jgi:hypothetical protein
MLELIPDLDPIIVKQEYAAFLNALTAMPSLHGVDVLTVVCKWYQGKSGDRYDKVDITVSLQGLKTCIID